jgi:hypothetical protein
VPSGSIVIRSSVPWELLLTHTDPSWTLRPFTPKPPGAVGWRSWPLAQTAAFPVRGHTFHTVPPKESTANSAPVPGSSARPLRNPASGRAATCSALPFRRIRQIPDSVPPMSM